MLQLIESKSWEIDVPGSSLLRPKILGDKHKPIFKIGLILSIHYHECDIRYSQIRKEKRKNKLKSNSYTLHSYTLKQLFSQNNKKGVVQYIWKT